MHRRLKLQKILKGLWSVFGFVTKSSLALFRLSRSISIPKYRRIRPAKSPPPFLCIHVKCAEKWEHLPNTKIYCNCSLRGSMDMHYAAKVLGNAVVRGPAIVSESLSTVKVKNLHFAQHVDCSFFRQRRTFLPLHSTHSQHSYSNSPCIKKLLFENGRKS